LEHPLQKGKLFSKIIFLPVLLLLSYYFRSRCPLTNVFFDIILLFSLKVSTHKCIFFYLSPYLNTRWIIQNLSFYFRFYLILLCYYLTIFVGGLHSQTTFLLSVTLSKYRKDYWKFIFLLSFYCYFIYYLSYFILYFSRKVSVHKWLFYHLSTYLNTGRIIENLSFYCRFIAIYLVFILYFSHTIRIAKLFYLGKDVHLFQGVRSQMAFLSFVNLSKYRKDYWKFIFLPPDYPTFIYYLSYNFFHNTNS